MELKIEFWMNRNNNIRNIDNENDSLHEDDTESDSSHSSDDSQRERRPFDVTLPPTHQYLRLQGTLFENNLSCKLMILCVLTLSYIGIVE